MFPEIQTVDHLGTYSGTVVNCTVQIFAPSTPMTAGDCYELGRALYNEKDFRNALAWMTEALRKYKDDDEPYTFTETDILEYISFSHYLLG